MPLFCFVSATDTNCGMNYIFFDCWIRKFLKYFSLVDSTLMFLVNILSRSLSYVLGQLQTNKSTLSVYLRSLFQLIILLSVIYFNSPLTCLFSTKQKLFITSLGTWMQKKTKIKTIEVVENKLFHTHTYLHGNQIKMRMNLS